MKSSTSTRAGGRVEMRGSARLTTTHRRGPRSKACGIAGSSTWSAWGSQRFADPDHMREYGFIVDLKPSTANPYQLPVGFAHHFAATFRMTCWT